jgi:WS/DGAT/MGAT family acyltransferase
MSKKSFSNIDFALLQMDAPNNLMVITGMMILETRLDVARLKATIEQRLLCFDRFRQRVVRSRRPLKHPYWQEDPHFDLDDHIVIIDRAMPADQQLLQHLVSKLMSLPLHPSRPLWQFFLVEHYGQGSALICRFHHSIADGIALMGVLLSLTDSEAITRTQLASALQTTHAAGNGEAFISGAKQAGPRALRDPQAIFNTLRQGADMLASMSRFVLRRPDPPTVLKGSLSGHKQAVWAGPLSLAQVKRIGRAFGCTLNDVLIAMLAGSFRKYLLDHNETISQDDLHSFVPVNLRSPTARERLGNQFGVFFLPLPVGLEDPVARLYHVHDHMDELKASNEAIATFGMLSLFGAMPMIQGSVLKIFDSKGTAVTTNVPGPQEQLYLAGAPIQTIMAWVPKSGHVGLGISILSYNGGVWLGIATDRKLVPDPERLLVYFDEEFQALDALAESRWARRSASVAPLLAELDGALHTIDEILVDSQASAPDAHSESWPRCQSLTKSGQLCKNRALPGKGFCRVHL